MVQMERTSFLTATRARGRAVKNSTEGLIL